MVFLRMVFYSLAASAYKGYSGNFRGRGISMHKFLHEHMPRDRDGRSTITAMKCAEDHSNLTLGFLRGLFNGSLFCFGSVE
jgi:hypothetical protein